MKPHVESEEESGQRVFDLDALTGSGRAVEQWGRAGCGTRLRLAVHKAKALIGA